jgi:hypothetical protein
MTITSDDRKALQKQITLIQEDDVDGIGSGRPVAINDFGEGSDRFAGIVKYPEIVIAEADGDWTLRETTAQAFQGISGLLCTREIPCHDERIRSMSGDPLLNLQERPFLCGAHKVEICGK